MGHHRFCHSIAIAMTCMTVIEISSSHLAKCTQPPAFAAASSAPIDSPVQPATVLRVSPERRTLLLEPSTLIAEIGDRVWILDSLRPLARGVIVMKRGTAFGVALDWMSSGFEFKSRMKAAVLAREILKGPADASARVVAPARVETAEGTGQSCWISNGPGAPFAVGITLSAEHGGWPIASLRIDAVEATRAHCIVTPLVGNTAVIVGDFARLWPNAGERKTGRLHTRVLRIKQDGPDQELWLPHPDPQESRPGERFAIFRDGQYVGIASVVSTTDRFLIANTNPALCRMPVRVGDYVVRRPTADVQSGFTPMYIFQVDGPYALVSAGETDGLRLDMPLFLMRDGRKVAELRVNTLNDEHCGVTLADSSATQSAAASSMMSQPTMRLWDTVYARIPPSATTQHITKILAEAGLVEVKCDAERATGSDVITVRSAGLAWQAIVLARTNSAALVAPVRGSIPAVAAPGDEWIDVEGFPP